MKYNNTNYLQLSRDIFTEEYRHNLTTAAKWLFCVMNEMEHRYAKEDGSFFRSNKDLAEDAGLSLRTMIRAKEELINMGLLEKTYTHWVNPTTGKRSAKHICLYRLKK